MKYWGVQPEYHYHNDVALQRRSRLTVVQSLMLRASAVIFMIAIALAGHWLHREGMNDNSDGHVSFLDIVYFTAVTVSTVGYGDVVPVTNGARMFDTFIVTPIRLFIWLIFLGTAYTFVLRKTWERWQTAMIKKSLSGHFIVCGYGTGGYEAVHELVKQGVSPENIVVIDTNAERIGLALQHGMVGIQGDATQNEVLEGACVARAKAVLVSMGRDDSAALAVLSVRQLNRSVPISTNVRAIENEDLLRQAGATSIINPISLGGHLLARSTMHNNAVNYIRDLASSGGRVVIEERIAGKADVGLTLKTLKTSLGLRLIRGEQTYGFWEMHDERIKEGDIIVEVVPEALRR